MHRKSSGCPTCLLAHSTSSASHDASGGCGSGQAQEMWGNELIAEIIRYRLHLLRRAAAEVYHLDLVKPTWLRFRDDYFT